MLPSDEEMLTIQVFAMSGQELEPVSIAPKEQVQSLCAVVLKQLPAKRISLIYAGTVLPMQEPVGSCLKHGDVVTVLIRPNAFMLKQADLDTGFATRLDSGARWQGETLLLDSVLACAEPSWDAVPDMRKNFAVEATVKLKEWPDTDYRGTIISQHGSGTGWELRCGGPGITALFTTSRGGHNELILFCKPVTDVWHHFCMTYDAETRTLRVTCDGREHKEKTLDGDFKPAVFKVVVGRNPEWAGRGIVGAVRNAAVWPEGFNFGLEDLPSRAAARVAEAQASE